MLTKNNLYKPTFFKDSLMLHISGQVFSSNGYHMYPRVFLITDGKPTDSGQVNGPDSYSSLKPAEVLKYYFLIITI